MIKHYFKSAMRQVRRTPLVTTLNVLSLALGFVCFAAAIGVSKYWSMSDQEFLKADRIHVLTQQFSEGGMATGYRPIVAAPIANYLREDFPQLEAVARIGNKRDWTVTTDDRSALLKGARADADILKIFDFDLIAGDLSAALETYDQVVITRRTAELLFGDANPIGKPIRFAEDFAPIVSAVIELPAEPSHMSADTNALGYFDFIYTWPDDSNTREWWLGISAVTYLLFAENVTDSAVEDMRSQFEGFIKRRLPADQAALTHTEIDLLPLSELQSKLIDIRLFEGGSKSLSIEKILTGLGLLVLLVACINYTNLATAQAVARTKEVGLRKVIGAGSVDILKQYWIEALCLTAAAAFLALVGLWLLAPVMYVHSGIDFRMGLFDDASPLFVIAGVVIAVAFLSSLYPVVVLSKVSPNDALRQTAAMSGSRRAGRVLVSLQFCVASTLLIMLIVINQQNQYLESRASLGSGEDVVLLTDEASCDIGFEAIYAGLSDASAVVAASQVDYMPWSDHENFLDISNSRDENEPSLTVFYSQVGYGFTDAFNQELLAGRVFEEGRN
ncbi:MAG: FtsX-like permease family protein, partial [Gammaproteobacteria bacterium]